jgi:hypothetical protein
MIHPRQVSRGGNFLSAPGFSWTRPAPGAASPSVKGIQMIETTSIREHMEVVGSDGQHVGKVDHVKGSEIELAKFDLGAGLKHHLIPITWVEAVADDKVRLSLTKDEARAQWMKEH